MLRPPRVSSPRVAGTCALSPTASRALATAVLSVLPAPATAQEQFATTGNGLPGAFWSQVLVDVDGDGDLDNLRGLSGRLGCFLNDGRGGFADVSLSSMPSRAGFPPRDMAVGDFDGDGDQDLVFVGEGFRGLYLNDGTGVFADASSRLPFVPSPMSQCVAVGDVDGDGDSDLWIGNSYQASGEQDRLFLNDGSGHFTDSTGQNLPSERLLTSALALGDVDGDGDLDVLCGAGLYSGLWLSWDPARLYLNNGQGHFVDASAQLPARIQATTGVALGDVDGDGDLDVVLSSQGYYAPNPLNTLYLNQGNGVFLDATATSLPSPLGPTGGVDLGDVDQDGDLDIVWSNAGYAGNSPDLLLNVGGGSFITPAAPRFGATIGRRPALGDLDGDGDLDLVSVSPGAQINLLSQVSSSAHPQIGQPYTLEFYARFRPTGASDVFVPVFSTRPASVMLPGLGTVGIDLAGAVAWPAVSVTQPSGVGSISVSVPNDPGLRGLPVFTQAVHFRGLLPPHLTNVVSDVVR